ncbi:MAG: GPR endopeptidase [Firmicutes bacterium]|nr:GPR endopeptidase [Bacillota bacterium]
MKYRTDLAVEGVESLENSGVKPGKKDGVIVENCQIDDDIKVTTVDIVNLKGEALLGKPTGRYVTMEIRNLMEEEGNLAERVARALSAELSKLVSHDYHRRVLVIGLGNEKVTPDSLGPAAVSKIKITSHLFWIFDCDGDEEMSNVSGLAPGVTAVTGIETADLIAKAVELTRPDTVIAIDALAARNIERVSTTIQISDTGISPGAGMGNMRKQLNEETLGTKVIAIGVPTVIDSATLILEAAEAMNLPEGQIQDYLQSREMDMVVTSTDIDFVIKAFSDIIAKAVNMTLHPGIYS